MRARCVIQNKNETKILRLMFIGRMPLVSRPVIETREDKLMIQNVCAQSHQVSYHILIHLCTEKKWRRTSIEPLSSSSSSSSSPYNFEGCSTYLIPSFSKYLLHKGSLSTLLDGLTTQEISYRHRNESNIS